MIPTGGAFVVDLACGDLDDASIPGFLGQQDIVAVHAGSGTVELHLGWNGAAFASLGNPTVGSNPVAAAVGDLDGDGGDEVVVVNLGSGDVTVVSTPQPALAQSFGTGCAGSGGLVPTLSGLELPTVGNPTFGVQLSNGRAISPAVLIFSTGLAVSPLAGSCTLYLASPASTLVRITGALGDDRFRFGVPNTPALTGSDLYMQYAVFDPGGAFAGLLSLSNALRLQVGANTP